MGKHAKKIDGRELLDQTEDAVESLEMVKPEPRPVDPRSGMERDFRELYEAD